MLSVPPRRPAGRCAWCPRRPRRLFSEVRTERSAPPRTAVCGHAKSARRTWPYCILRAAGGAAEPRFRRRAYPRGMDVAVDSPSLLRGRWREVARASNLLDAEGHVAPTVFAQMSALAVATGSINLGQGFPDTDGPASLLRDAADAVLGGVNQYPPGRGVPELRQAVAEHQRRFYGLDLDPDTEVLVTAGATEAIAAALLALAGPRRRGRRPRALLRRLRRVHRARGCRAPHGAAAVPRLHARARGPGRRRRAADPGDPAQHAAQSDGHVLSAAELAEVAAVAIEHDLLVITDEVYEHLLFDGRRARAARDPARHGRAHPDDLQRRQDVLGRRAGRSAGSAGRRSSWRP